MDEHGDGGVSAALKRTDTASPQQEPESGLDDQETEKGGEAASEAEPAAESGQDEDGQETDEKLFLLTCFQPDPDADLKPKPNIQYTRKRNSTFHKMCQAFDRKMCQALHIVSCKQLADLDPKKNALVPTRFYTFNTTFFDLDAESEAIHGPPIRGLPFLQFRKNVGLSNNVVSIKVTESDVGYPIRVFGTVLARDVLDYKCLYLFRRERDDAQLINSPKDELILTGPRRALVTPDRIFFEINLKIKGAPGIAEGDFSKGVMEHNTICSDNRAIAIGLTSWRSTVELVCTPVPYPVEATLEVKILKGPRDVPFSSHVITWTDGYEDNPITLYEYDASCSRESGTRGSIGDDGSVALDRNLVAVPVILPRTVDEYIAIVLDIGLMESHGTEEFTHVALRYPCEEVVCRNGSYELQLKVTWRAVRYSPNHDRCLSMPVPPRTAYSWMWYRETPHHPCCLWRPWRPCPLWLSRRWRRVYLGILASISPIQRISVYADDVVLFLKPKCRELWAVKHILSLFGEASGLHVNFSKTTATLIRGTHEEEERTARILGCELATFPIRYLGLQLALWPLTKAEWQSLLDQVIKCVPAWQRGLVRREGRLVLINSVVAIRAVHQMVVAEAPVWLLEEINKWMRAFFWGGKDDVRGGQCLVAWKSICKPKEFGGLGVKDLRLQGLALRVRWHWLRRTDQERPWQGLPGLNDPEAAGVF
ncbi:hypothetical protein ACQ4PT_027328 [Festuca glaucescens]